jgi:hypothetical protein
MEVESAIFREQWSSPHRCNGKGYRKKESPLQILKSRIYSPEVDTVHARLHQSINLALFPDRVQIPVTLRLAVIRSKHTAPALPDQAKPHTRNGGQPHVQPASAQLDGFRQTVAQAWILSCERRNRHCLTRECHGGQACWQHGSSP